MKKLIAILLAVLILAIIFTRIDLKEFFRYISQMDFISFSIALLLFFPLVMIPAWRWKFLVRKKTDLRLSESVKLVLASSALNIFLPSKMGDLSKSYFLKKKCGVDLKRATNVLIFERYVDTAALSAMALLGALGARPFSNVNWIVIGFSTAVILMFPVLYFLNFDQKWAFSALNGNRYAEKLRHFLHDAQDYLGELKRDPRSLAVILAVSIFLWFLHLLQFYFAFLAIRAEVPWPQIFGLVPMAIFVGMLPITVAGIGSRDAALIQVHPKKKAIFFKVGG